MTKRGLVRKVEETRGRPLKSYKILLNPTNNQLTIYNTEQSAPRKVLIVCKNEKFWMCLIIRHVFFLRYFPVPIIA